MRYLIIPKNQEPFLTNWFDYENNYTKGIIIIDNVYKAFSIDGKNWKALEVDRL